MIVPAAGLTGIIVGFELVVGKGMVVPGATVLGLIAPGYVQPLSLALVQLRVIDTMLAFWVTGSL